MMSYLIESANNLVYYSYIQIRGYTMQLLDVYYYKNSIGDSNAKKYYYYSSELDLENVNELWVDKKNK